MKSIKLTDDELWMLRIALENELKKYDYWYEPDERTELNVWLLKSLIHKFEVEPENSRINRIYKIDVA